MLTRLILENFMAHGRTELPLGPGLTVLTGPNNVGKSAVVEALRCLASNPTPRHYIRHGAKEARVTAVFEDGTEVTWVRREKYAQYEILRPGAAEPELFTKLGNVITSYSIHYTKLYDPPSTYPARWSEARRLMTPR